MIGDVEELTTLATSVTGGYTLFVPLQFWFCRNYGLALPLIALQYHEVRINIEFEDISNLVVYTKGTGDSDAPRFNSLQYGSSGILVDYVYLDSEERRRFAQVGHEYLIEQVQYNEANLTSGTSQNVQLNFNHPCKELVWAHRLGAFNGQNGSTFLGYTSSDSWTTELQAAADRLALSMIFGKTTGSTGEDDDQNTFAVSTDATVVPVNVGDAVWKFTIVDSPSAEVKLKVLKKPLVSGSFNLASRLQTVSVDVSFNTSDSNALTILNVHVTDHSMTMVDLSTPLANYTTDNRVAGADTTGLDVAVVQLNNYGVNLDGTGNIVTTGNLNFNGHDRFALREGAYFNYVQPNDHHSRTPADGINVYAFGLHPEQHQPTGTANLSRIDQARLIYKVADPMTRDVSLNIYTGTLVHIFVNNYNVLRIMSGMGGLAYSN